MSNENIVAYDSPSDIHSMSTLKIEAAPNEQLKIFANGKHQCKVDIALQAKDKNKKVLNLSDQDWIHITNLRFYDSAEKLNWGGSSGWSYAWGHNEFFHPFPSSTAEVCAPLPMNADVDVKDGVKILSYYIYTDKYEDQAIAVSVDVDNGPSFMTTKSPVGAQSSYVTVQTAERIYFTRDDFHINREDSLGVATHTCNVYIGGSHWTSGGFPSGYNNYKITPANFHMYKYEFSFDHRSDDFIQDYDSNNDNQFFIVPHTPDLKGVNSVGFRDSAEWDGVYRAEYDLTKNIDFNPTENDIYISLVYFICMLYWPIPDNIRLNRSGSIFDGDAHLYIYDTYGNRADIKYEFSSNHQNVSFEVI